MRFGLLSAGQVLCFGVIPAVRSTLDSVVCFHLLFVGVLEPKLLNSLWNSAQVWDQLPNSILMGGILYRIVAIRSYSSQRYGSILIWLSLGSR